MYFDNKVDYIIEKFLITSLFHGFSPLKPLIDYLGRIYYNNTLKKLERYLYESF